MSQTTQLGASSRTRGDRVIYRGLTWTVTGAVYGAYGWEYQLVRAGHIEWVGHRDFVADCVRV